MTKRLLALTVVMGFIFVACGDDDGEASSEDPAAVLAAYEDARNAGALT